jgi:putative AlgH/UPF0301 family transcriptional regulator
MLAWIIFQCFSAACRFSVALYPPRIDSHLYVTPSSSVGIASVKLGSVEEGCLLVAQPNEYNHFMVRGAVLIIHHAPEQRSRGLLLDHPTAFTVGETAPALDVFAENTLFLGGEAGANTALMLHRFALPGARAVGGSGLYLGGVRSAMEKVEAGEFSPGDFIFVFNECEWEPGVLQQEVEAARWTVLRCPPHFLMPPGAGRARTSSLWERCRREIRRLGLSSAAMIGNEEDVPYDESFVNE